ncbi:MAG: cytochrome c3 family protein [Armatimonadota bacterium]|nr:cytochrome c3 family protein [Armatimonadota bacterium]
MRRSIVRTAIRGLTVAATLAAALCGVGMTAGPAKPAAVSAGYVGHKVCLKCHIKFAKNWATLPHSKRLIAGAKKTGEGGCEACHGPGAAHVSGNRKKIISFDNIDPKTTNAICLKCHRPKVKAELWNAGAHGKTGMTCLLCHDPHRPVDQKTLLKRPPAEVCRPCHQGTWQSAKEGKHHKLPNGLMCSSCHTPHGSGNPKLLTAPKGDLCKKCHAGASPRPSSHSAADWAKAHGKTAKPDVASCESCHDKARFCDSCHGTAMPHPDGWMMEHKSKGASLAEGSPCFKCHSKQEFCSRCHGSG